MNFKDLDKKINFLSLYIQQKCKFKLQNNLQFYNIVVKYKK